MEELCRTKIEAAEMDNATKISLPTRYRPSACRYDPAVAHLPVSKTSRRKSPLIPHFLVNHHEISIPSVRTKARVDRYVSLCVNIETF